MGLEDVIPDEVKNKDTTRGRTVKPSSIRCNDIFLQRMAQYEPIWLMDIIRYHPSDKGPSQKSLAKTMVSFLDNVVEDEIQESVVSESEKNAAQKYKEKIKDEFY